MRQILIMFLIALSSIANGQNTELLRFEKIAVDFFADSICNDLTKSKIYYDGKIFNKGIDSSYINYIINDYFGFKTKKMAENEVECNKYWQLYRKYLADLQTNKNNISIDSINYKSYCLDFKKPIIAKDRLKYTKLKGGLLRYYCKKVKSFFFKEKFNLDLTRSVKFGDYNWIRIRQDRPDLEYGVTYIILISDNGKVFDYIDIPWIQ